MSHKKVNSHRCGVTHQLQELHRLMTEAAAVPYSQQGAPSLPAETNPAISSRLWFFGRLKLPGEITFSCGLGKSQRRSWIAKLARVTSGRPCYTCCHPSWPWISKRNGCMDGLKNTWESWSLQCCRAEGEAESGQAALHRHFLSWVVVVVGEEEFSGEQLWRGPGLCDPEVKAHVTSDTVSKERIWVCLLHTHCSGCQRHTAHELLHVCTQLMMQESESCVQLTLPPTHEAAGHDSYWSSLHDEGNLLPVQTSCRCWRLTFPLRAVRIHPVLHLFLSLWNQTKVP